MIPVPLPGTLIWPYYRISELDFKRACFILLAVSGLELMIKTLLK
jgi:hypothetical protein